VRLRREELPRDDRRHEETIQVVNALRPLLAGVVDYAGLFPPAALDMPAAVRNYAEYLADRDAWMLGRFVVPIARLDELTTELSMLEEAPEWRVAALLGTTVKPDIEAARQFNEEQAGRARIDTLEGKLTTPGAIADAASLIGEDFALYAEIPVVSDPAALVAAIASAGVNAKIRTGGVTPDAFPAADQIVRFMRRCAEHHVMFKATAGLHHPLRSEHRLTYAADAPRGVMYGYLNVFLTAALLAQLTDAEARDLLEEQDPRAILVERDRIAWRGHELRADEISAARDLVASSFGSCSFREPVDELRELAFLS
jgi:hypothetical protein